MKKKNRKRRVLRYVVGGCALVLLAAAAAGAWAWSVAGAEYQGERVRLYVPAGSSAQAVADTLQSALGQDFGVKAARLWRWLDSSPRLAEGSYVVDPGMSALAVSRMLQRGFQAPVRVTFNNVRTLDQMAERVTASLEMRPADFMAACDSLLPALGYAPEQFPAAFLPDTYEFYWNASPSAVVKRLEAARGKFWTPERRAKAADLGLTPEQAAVVASIVEEETAKADERPKVARLYLNRLKKGMFLQADPTVKFAVGDFGLRRILNKHLETPSPYNTYKHAGLPPGPIRVATARAIDDVLNAPQHDYLYMCAKEDFSGYHNFARDYATHLANARRYQAELNRRNIH